MQLSDDFVERRSNWLKLNVKGVYPRTYHP